MLRGKEDFLTKLKKELVNLESLNPLRMRDRQVATFFLGFLEPMAKEPNFSNLYNEAIVKLWPFLYPSTRIDN
mgnify:CR=1 FL=1